MFRSLCRLFLRLGLLYHRHPLTNWWHRYFHRLFLLCQCGSFVNHIPILLSVTRSKIMLAFKSKLDERNRAIEISPGEPRELHKKGLFFPARRISQYARKAYHPCLSSYSNRMSPGLILSFKVISQAVSKRIILAGLVSLQFVLWVHLSISPTLAFASFHLSQGGTHP